MSKLWLNPWRARAWRVAAPRRSFCQRRIAPENLHRLADRGAHHRLAETTDRAAERGFPIVRRSCAPSQHLAREQQRKGRGVDERGIAAAELFRPVGPASLSAISSSAVCRRECAAAPRRGTSSRCLPPTPDRRLGGTHRARRLVRADALDQRSRGGGGIADLVGISRASAMRSAATASSSGR